MITITRRFSFAGAHDLSKHAGKCKNLHGHEWQLEVEIAGEVCKDSNQPHYGMIMDFGVLKNVVEDAVLQDFDHQYLNNVVEYPTAEFMITVIKNRINEYLPAGVQIYSLKLYETPNSWVTWRW